MLLFVIRARGHIIGPRTRSADLESGVTDELEDQPFSLVPVDERPRPADRRPFFSKPLDFVDLVRIS